LIFTLITVLIAACSNHRDYPFVDAYLTKAVDYNGDTIWDRYVEVFDVNGLPMIPAVKLNGEEVILDQYGYITCIYNDTIHFAPNQEYELTVDHYYGQANAKIWMPGDFSMISPDTNYILKRDSILSVTWHKSEKARQYYFYVDLEYEDENGEDFEFFHDTIVDDTIIRYPPNRIFSESTNTIMDGDGEAAAWALNGPYRYEQGTKGNIQGQGLGYFSATYQPKALEFYVGAPGKTPKLRKSSKVWDRFKARILGNPENPLVDFQ
jgi:hypothetical protein